MPLYWFSIDTDLSPEDVSECIESLIQERQSFWFFWPFTRDVFQSSDEEAAPFIGSINGNTFSIRRNIGYRNSFLSSMRGRIFPQGSGSRVRVVMYINLLVVISLAVLLWDALSGWSITNRQAPEQGYTEAGAIVFFIALVLIYFFLEAFKTRRIIEAAVRDASAVAKEAISVMTSPDIS